MPEALRSRSLKVCLSFDQNAFHVSYRGAWICMPPEVNSNLEVDNQMLGNSKPKVFLQKQIIIYREDFLVTADGASLTKAPMPEALRSRSLKVCLSFDQNAFHVSYRGAWICMPPEVNSNLEVDNQMLGNSKPKVFLQKQIIIYREDFLVTADGASLTKAYD
nr:hypothetical protein [Tanacetum cinerariifolium]